MKKNININNTSIRTIIQGVPLIEYTFRGLITRSAGVLSNFFILLKNKKKIFFWFSF